MPKIQLNIASLRSHAQMAMVGFSVLALAIIAGGISVGLQARQRHPITHEAGSRIVSHTPVRPLPDSFQSVATHVTIVAVANTDCAQNSQGQRIFVSISQQHLWACQGTSLVRDSVVTTGASALTNVDDATPVGSWHIYNKATNLHLRGSDANGNWDDPVSYWMPFDGGVGFHDASWQTFPFGSGLYTTQGSHGCVHVPLDTLSWLYDWAAIGTAVTVES